MKSDHPRYRRMELYVMGRLGAPDSPPVVRLEKHLLACSACVDRAERTVEFVQAMRDVLRDGEAARVGGALGAA